MKKAKFKIQEILYANATHIELVCDAQEQNTTYRVHSDRFNITQYLLKHILDKYHYLAGYIDTDNPDELVFIVLSILDEKGNEKKI